MTKNTETKAGSKVIDRLCQPVNYIEHLYARETRSRKSAASKVLARYLDFRWLTGGSYPCCRCKSIRRTRLDFPLPSSIRQDGWPRVERVDSVRCTVTIIHPVLLLRPSLYPVWTSLSARRHLSARWPCLVIARLINISVPRCYIRTNDRATLLVPRCFSRSRRVWCSPRFSAFRK